MLPIGFYVTWVANIFFPSLSFFSLTLLMVIFHTHKTFFKLCNKIYLFYYYYFWIWCRRKVIPIIYKYKGINPHFLLEFIWISFLTCKSLIYLGFTLYTNSWIISWAKTSLVWYVLFSGESYNNCKNYYNLFIFLFSSYSLTDSNIAIIMIIKLMVIAKPNKLALNS